jgi:hypothetical protein
MNEATVKPLYKNIIWIAIYKNNLKVFLYSGCHVQSISKSKIYLDLKKTLVVLCLPTCCFFSKRSLPNLSRA